MGITHFDEAPSSPDFEFGHLRGKWTFLGEAAGSVGVGVRRIQIPAGGWSTPAHEHGREEEIFYVLGGTGLSWQKGATAPIRAGDCIVYLPKHGAHTLHATEPLDVLAFGPRHSDDIPRFPRLGMSLVGGRAVDSAPGSVEGAPVQFVREAKIGAPELPAEPGPRPPTIANIDDVEPQRTDQKRVQNIRRDIARAAGSVTTGLKHVTVAPGMEAVALHCHSAEEELFVILDGDGVLVLASQEDDHEPGPFAEAEISVRPGTVVSRPPGTGVAHTFRAGPGGLTMLAYGTRQPNDICYYPRSDKIAFWGVGVIGRIERLAYWDGEG